MDINIAILSAVVAYLIGGISFSRIVTHLVAPDVDLENVHFPTANGGEGQRLRSVGATTASLELGPKAGCTIGILDILKAVVLVLALKLLYPGDYYHLIAAVFVVVGHNWPVYFRFKGGGGISPTYGGFFVVDFVGTIVSASAGMIFGFFVVREILIAYVSGLWFMLLWLIIFKGDWPHIVYGVVMNLVFTLAVLPDLKEQLGKRREGDYDMRAGLEMFPMGRGMLKIMRFFHIEPKTKQE
jgi:acyl-phosphate glycerol 3-phosphate acyltransferase